MKGHVWTASLACVLGATLTMAQVPSAPTPGTPPAPLCQGAPARGAAAAAPASAPGQGPGQVAQGRGQGRGAVQPQGERQVIVTAIAGVVAAGATFTQVFSTFGANADGIIAAPDGRLLINQEENNAVISIDKDDRASIFLTDTNGSGALSRDRQGRILAVQRMPAPGSPAALRATGPATAGVSMLFPDRKIVADTFADGTKWTGRPNDLTADGTGGAYFTQGCVYYASAGGRITLVGEDLNTNGIVLSLDGKQVLVTNSTAGSGTVVAFDVEGPGTLTGRRTFAMLQAGSNGDAMTVDSAGRLYVASAPGVQVFSAEGASLGLIPTPRAVTGEVFAGPNRNTLYMVSNAAIDGAGRSIAGRTIYRLPMLAQGVSERSK
jgi:gluconolactonase